MIHTKPFFVATTSMGVILILAFSNMAPASAASTFECEEPGYFADPNDCTRFHVCQLNEAGDLWDTEFQCPDTTVWCQKEGQCANPLDCPCPGSPTLTTSDPEVTTSTTTESWEDDKPRTCADIKIPDDSDSSKKDGDGHTIYPFGPNGRGIQVTCDFETDGGVWTIIHQRWDGPLEDFYRDWADYEHGFGNHSANYWIGLEVIAILTQNNPQQLRIDLGDWQNKSNYAVYNSFSISSAEDAYRLSINGFDPTKGSAGDSMAYHDGQKFSTKDVDNDNAEISCARGQHGAWWYDRCNDSNLNGYYYPPASANTGDCMSWGKWLGHGYSLKTATMKIREPPTTA